MSYFITNIGDAEVAIVDTTPTEANAIKARSDFPGDQETSREARLVSTLPTRISNPYGKIENVLDDLGPILNGITKKGQELLNKDLVPPDELSLTFGLGYSVEANLWMIGGKADMALEIEMKWKKKGTSEQQAQE